MSTTNIHFSSFKESRILSWLDSYRCNMLRLITLKVGCPVLSNTAALWNEPCVTIIIQCIIRPIIYCQLWRRCCINQWHFCIHFIPSIILKYSKQIITNLMKERSKAWTINNLRSTYHSMLKRSIPSKSCLFFISRTQL